MKNITIILVVILGLVVVGCSSPQVETTLKVQLKNTESIKIHKRNVVNAKVLLKDTIAQEVRLDLSNETFPMLLEYKVGEGQKAKKKYVYLEQGNNVIFKFDSIKGVGSENNVVYNEYKQHKFKTGLSPLKLIDSSLAFYMNYLEENERTELGFIKRSELSPDFKRFLGNDIRYFRAAKTLSFPNLKRNFNKGEDFDVPDGYYSYSDTIQKDNPLALLSSYYDAFLTQYLQQEMARVAHENSYDGQIKVLYEEFGSKVADIKATKVIYQGIRTKHLDSKDQSLLIAEHKSKFPESEAIEFIMEEHSKALVSANGKPAFNGVVENTDGNMVELLKYSGKPLLIDVWASWCSPCLKNMKFLEPIKEKYKDELCVIYVSVDEKSKDWITAIEKNNLSANVNYLTRGKQSEFAKFYDISNVPRYILIDKEGNIANNNAPSPAKRELLLAEIEKLIN